MRKERGFTLIEMMAVVLILGLVTTVLMVNVFEQVEWARVETTKIKMRTLEGALELFQFDKGNYPKTQPGLGALLGEGEGERRFVRDATAFDDAWKRPFGYASPASRARRDPYDLWSLGSDGATGGEGPDADIVSWEPARPRE